MWNIYDQLKDCFPFFMGLLLFSSCAGSNHQQPKTVSLPNDLKISIYRGGGVAGLWEGYIIEANGTVSHWQGRLPETNPEVAGQLSPQELSDLWNAIQRTDFFNATLSRTGNMTFFIKIRASGRQHSVSWAAQPEPADRQVQRFQNLYMLIKQAAEKDRD